MLNIALFGPPGAGKGTQSKKLIEKYNLAYISTGDMLREEIAKDTELGRIAAAVINKGHLLSDEFVVQLIEDRLTNYKNVNGFLFDGFPRTTVQAYILEGILLKMNSSLDCMLSLEVPFDILKHRMLERAKIENRVDDTEEVIENRFQEYREKTVPVANFYKEKGIYYPIDGTGSMNDVFDELTNAVEKTHIENKKNFIVMGAPGAGKGTQCKRLAEKYGLVFVPTGSMIRDEIDRGSLLGKQAVSYIEKGDIVPDEIAIKLIERRLKEHPNAKGFIFKGFPRTIVQAYILDGLLMKHNSKTTAVINLEVPTLESIRRLSKRGKTFNKRPYDKDADIIIRRLERHETFTPKVVEFYDKQSKYAEIDGTSVEDTVFKEMCDIFDKFIKK
ncbi:MAG: adenylate kinase [Marinifilaceae bacterium]|jgi:adenylate kinase